MVILPFFKILASVLYPEHMGVLAKFRPTFLPVSPEEPIRHSEFIYLFRQTCFVFFAGSDDWFDKDCLLYKNDGRLMSFQGD